MKSKAQKIVDAYKGGSLYLRGCDLTGITLTDALKSKVIK